MEIEVADNAYYYNLGDWIADFTYGKFKQGHFELMQYQENTEDIVAERHKA
jgi:hypothetical protein